MIQVQDVVPKQVLDHVVTLEGRLSALEQAAAAAAAQAAAAAAAQAAAAAMPSL